MSTGFSRSREEYYAKIRLYCVNVCTDYCKIMGEPLGLSRAVELVRRAIAREGLIQVPHEELTIRRRFNEAARADRYRGGITELVCVGHRELNGISDSYYIANPLRLDEETRAKLERWLPQKVEQATLL